MMNKSWNLEADQIVQRFAMYVQVAWEALPEKTIITTFGSLYAVFVFRY